MQKEGGGQSYRDTPLPYLHELPYAKIIEFCVDPAVSSIKLSKKYSL